MFVPGMFNLILLLALTKFCLGVPPTPTSTEYLRIFRDDLKTIKLGLKALTENLEKWNYIYISQLEPKIASFVNTQATIDSNVRNLLERAHVWDTFQLHIAAWNDQLATSDRKLDIISKTQQDTLSDVAKVISNLNFENKLERILEKVDEFDTTMLKLSKKVETLNHFHDNLLGEFTIRGILSTLKLIEKKLDSWHRSTQTFLGMQQSLLKKNFSESSGKLTIRCNTPTGMQELLHDVASKVDAIFDKVGIREGNGKALEEDDYLDDELQSNDDEAESNVEFVNAVLRRVNQPWKRTNKMIGQLMEQLQNLGEIVREDCVESSKFLLSNTQHFFDKLTLNSKLLSQDIKYELNSLEDKFNTSVENQKTYIHQLFTSHSENSCIKNQYNPIPEEESQQIPVEPYKIIKSNSSSCDELKYGDENGIYDFQNNSKPYDFLRFCEILDGNGWTVIQNRDNFSALQNFSLNWRNYKIGFGRLDADFWFGNDNLNLLSQHDTLILRVELEDFDGNYVWAEYDTFKVASEHDNYTLTVGGYKGNASDSFSSHNGSSFSTYDVKNDNAPECCPCANSYGGGWWFDSCFECNLNGVYHRTPHSNEYFRGIIWESWLGDYSLKKTKLMVRQKLELSMEETFESSGDADILEDP